MAVAGKRSQRDLAIAVNGRPERLVRIAAWTWNVQNDDYRKDARSGLRDVPEKYRHIQENPGTLAAEATTKHLYRSMTIVVARGAITTRCRSDGFSHEARYTTATEAQAGFDADGLNAALKARGWNPRRILKEATAALTSGRSVAITPLGGESGGQGDQEPHVARAADAPVGGNAPNAETLSRDRPALSRSAAPRRD